MTRTTRKTVCFAVCVAILLVAVSALAWATSGFKNWNAKSWFDYWGKGAPAVTAPEDPEQLPDTSSMTMQAVMSANTDQPGIHHDSADGTATVTIPDVPKPTFLYVYDIVHFHVEADDYTDLAIDITFKYFNEQAAQYEQITNKRASLVKTDGKNGVTKDGEVSLRLSDFYDLCSPLIQKYQGYGFPTPDTWFIIYEAYTITANGFRSESLVGDVFVLGEYTNRFYQDHVSGDITIDGTSCTLPGFYSYDDIWNTVGTMPVNEVLYFGYEIKVYPDIVDRRFHDGIYQWDFDQSTKPTDSVYFAEYSTSNINRYVETMCPAITRNMTTGDYTIDLTQLSFANDLHPDGCTIVATPYVYSKSELLGMHKSYVSEYFVDPIYFVIDRLATPSNIQFDENGNLTWNEVAGANGYAVFVGDDTETVETNSYDMKKYPSGEYTVRIRALGNVGQVLAASETGVMTLSAYNASNNITQMVALTYAVDGDKITKLVPRGKAVKDYLYDVDIDGREFGGWFYDSGYTTPVTDTDVLEKDTAIYARLSDRQVTERPLTWWEKNMWYILIPCIILVGVLIITVIAAIIQNKRKH